MTISVLNNQMPMMPLFSPVYSSTCPYSQTRSNTQRDLMNPAEVLRLENKKCLALFKGRKPALLYKMTPEELPDYAGLTTCRDNAHTEDIYSRELVKETPNQQTNQFDGHTAAPTRYSEPGGRLLIQKNSTRQSTPEDGNWGAPRPRGSMQDNAPARSDRRICRNCL